MLGSRHTYFVRSAFYVATETTEMALCLVKSIKAQAFHFKKKKKKGCSNVMMGTAN